MHQFPQQQAVRLGGAALLGKLSPECWGHLVCHVQAPAVHANFRQPVLGHAEDVGPHLWARVVQHWEALVAFPAPEVHAAPRPLLAVVPPPVLRRAALRLDVAAREEAPARVVEDPIQYDPNTLAVGSLHNSAQHVHISQPTVHGEVVRRVVAMAELGGLEEGAKVQHSGTKPLQVSRHPALCQQLLQALHRGAGAVVRQRLGAAEAKGLDLVDQSFQVPSRRPVSSHACRVL
mmetsp:Transcript_9929/g.28018  ORF Transcript_9929/g.28018 Transcript_9929/m.28018 type:complete len:233 (+) Transcript_9929:764-1462(+)